MESREFFSLSSCIQRSYIFVDFLHFLLLLFPGVLWAIQRTGLGWELLGGSHFVALNTPTTLPAINISHIFGWPSYVRFYALLLTVFWQLVFGCALEGGGPELFFN
jgi:hypothetical protein